MPWARASSLHRFMACSAASWLPRFDDGTGRVRPGYLWAGAPDYSPDNEELHNPELLKVRSKRAADRGRAAHAAKERGELAPELWRGMDERGGHEVSFSYCCKTGKMWTFEHASEHARDIWKALQCGHSVVGTADWVGWVGGRDDGSPWVDDLKTGWRTPEVLTPQMLFYAMCWGNISPTRDVLVSVTHQPNAKGVPTREGLWRRVTPLMIEQFRMDLTDAWTRTTLSRRPQAGEHCQWCPSAPWCSAATAAAV